MCIAQGYKTNYIDIFTVIFDLENLNAIVQHHVHVYNISK